jgi:hypothetical protein
LTCSQEFHENDQGYAANTAASEDGDTNLRVDQQVTIVDNNNDPLAHGFVVDPEFVFDWDDDEVKNVIAKRFRQSLLWPIITIRELHDKSAGETQVERDHFLKLQVIPYTVTPVTHI